MTWVWLDGRVLPERKALLPATDPAFLHGRGLFETLRGYDGVPFRLDRHLARMRASARHFRIPFRVPRLDRVIPELCRRNRAPDAAVRLTLSGGGHLLVTARPRKPLPRSWYRRGAEVMIAPWTRHPEAPLSGHKTVSYLENVLAHEEALRRGCADALTVAPGRRILEGSVTNLFLVKRDRIYTPPLRHGVLPGVTRGVILEIAPVRERVIRARELFRANEVFLTNSLIEVLPVGRPGPVTRVIAQAYREQVAEETGRPVSR